MTEKEIFYQAGEQIIEWEKTQVGRFKINPDRIQDLKKIINFYGDKVREVSVDSVYGTVEIVIRSKSIEENSKKIADTLREAISFTAGCAENDEIDISIKIEGMCEEVEYE